MDERLIQTHSLKQIIDRMFPDMLTVQILTQVLGTLKKQRKVSLKELADLILFIADTSHRNWNIETILNCINDTFDGINWRDVYEKFLEADIKIWNTEYLYTLVDCWVYISGIITVPYEIFFRRWPNKENQIDFYRILLESDEKRTQVYSNIFFEKIVTKDDFKNTKYKRSIEYESNLNSVELFKSLRDIGGAEIIEYIRGKSPEYCILGLAAVQPFCEEIFDDLLVYFSEGVTSQFVYYVLFSKHREFTFHAFKRISDRISLTRMLDIFLEHKMLPTLTEVVEPKDLCFDIVILSSRRDHLNLEIWLLNNLKQHSHAFVLYLANKLLHTGRKDILGSLGKENYEFDTLCRSSVVKSDTEIFPFNRAIVSAVFKIIDSNTKDLDEESLCVVREMRMKMAESRSFEKPNYTDGATTFISEVINSHIEVEDSIFKLKELVRGDETSIRFAKRVFGLLIDNYTSLYKLPNSDMLAVFFGELIRRKILFKPFMKVALQLVKNSLKFPESDREYAFAFRILEIFLNDVPEFFNEIEDVENARCGLIKKELIIVDEDAQREVDLDGLLTLVFNKEEDISHVGDFITKGIEHAIGNLKITGSDAVNYYVSFDDSVISNSSSTVTYSQLCRYIYRNMNQKKLQTFINYCLLQKNSFREFMTEKGFVIVKAFFIYKIDSEIEYSRCLGLFLGKITIGQNKPVNLDLFDFKSFILKSIEYRRISVCVYFVTSFLREGSHGVIFVPHNPWLEGILDVLSELWSCTLVHIRECISDLFKHFGLPLVHKPSAKMKEHLIKYVIEYEGILRQVISAALDFSVREICNKIIKSCLSVTRNTSTKLFRRIRGGNRFFLLRNLLVNLTRSLIHISSQEPLKASMCGNITHFLKLSMCELPLDEVYGIATKNLKICCSIIEKAGITQANDMVSALYNELVSEGRGSAEEGHTINLRILTESCFAEKTSIRSIENVEYQEIRSFLVQIGRRMPAKKKDYVSEEWPSLLSPSRTKSFKKMLGFLSGSPDKDEQCLSLCKYLVGHALRTQCADEFVFEFISKTFDISYKTKREVVGWLIYSEDSKRYSIPLIQKFIEYDLLCVEEYDQALSRFLKGDDPKCLSFTLDLLNALMLRDIRLCTVYDFIYTIEVLNKMNDSPKVFEFFKKIEQGMMKFNEGSCEPCTFDEFVRSCKFTMAPEQYLGAYKEKYKIESLNLRAAFKSCWHHFVLYSGSYRFFKIDILSSLARENLFSTLKESLKLLVQAYSKRHYLFFLFYCRFISKLLDFVEDTVENRTLVWKTLEILFPSSLPGFTVQLLEILDHRFVAKFLERNEGFFIAKELLEILSSNPRIESLIAGFFLKHHASLRRFNLYLSFMCPHSCVNLKNLFNQFRPKQIPEKGTNSFFSTFYCLSRQIKPSASFADLIDNLNEQNSSSAHSIDCLRFMLDRKMNVKEIVLMLMIRSAGQSVPSGLKAASDELLKRNDVKELVLEYESKFFNKL